MMINCAEYNEWEITGDKNQGMSFEQGYDHKMNILVLDKRSHSNTPHLNMVAQELVICLEIFSKVSVKLI